MRKHHLLASLVVLAAFVFGCGKKPDALDDTDDTPLAQPEPIAKPSPRPDPPSEVPKLPEVRPKRGLGATDYKLTVEEFANEFKADSQAAQAKFAEKVVELTGTVAGVGWLKDKCAYINLQSALEGQPLCIFTFDNRTMVRSLGKGQTVRLRGKYQIEKGSARRYFSFTSSEVVMLC